MPECVFCRVYENEKIKFLYEDKICFVVLDKYSTTKGHSLVITKKHYKNMLEVPDDALEHCFKIAKYFGIRIIAKLNTKALLIRTNIGASSGQLIMHFHIHVKPADEETGSYVYYKEDRLPIGEEERLIKILKTDRLY